MENLDLYKCEICGNLVEVVLTGGGELVCCGKPMKKLEAQTHEESMMENHVPVFVKRENGDEEIRVGEVLHPMTKEHYIMFIETISKDRKRVQFQYLNPNDEPKMILSEKFGDAFAREFCNLHGLWRSD